MRDAILANVLAAMQPAEELGGSDEHDYVVLMQDIASEAERRISAITSIQTPGKILSIEPEGDAVEYTYFDCWTTTGDEDGEMLDLQSTEGAKFAESILSGWAESLNVPSINPVNLAPLFEQWWLALGWETVFQVVAYKLAEAGYDVYLSDTRVEIYKK